MKKHERIGGWLLLPILGLVLSPFVLAFNLLIHIVGLASGDYGLLTATSSPYYHPWTAPIIGFEIFMIVFFLIATAFLIKALIEKKKYFPKLIVPFYLINFFYILADTLILAQIPWAIDAYAIDGDNMYTELFRAFISAIVWVPYFLFSKRVKGSFTKAGKLPKNFYAGLTAVLTLIAFLFFSIFTFSYFNKAAEGIHLTDEVKSSVVNILCPPDVDEFDPYGENVVGGSGVIFLSDGTIFTNTHIFPQDDEQYLIHENGCFAILPDPKTGEPDEIYIATPYIIEGWSEYYDLAYLEISGVYEDEEFVPGEYPRVFPSIESVPECSMADLALGDPVTILGYPSLSGGINLTITEGVVSGFDFEYLTILTSAQITSGNSGGLALAKNGCYIGIPSYSYTEDVDSLGEILSLDYISEFLDKSEEEYVFDAE